MPRPSEPVAQPDPHEDRARDFAEYHLSGLLSWVSYGAVVTSLAALLRERDAAAERRGAEAMRREAARLSDRRAAEQEEEAQLMAEHYPDDESIDADMYHADSIGAKALAAMIRALPLPGDEQGE